MSIRAKLSAAFRVHLSKGQHAMADHSGVLRMFAATVYILLPGRMYTVARNATAMRVSLRCQATCARASHLESDIYP